MPLQLRNSPSALPKFTCSYCIDFHSALKRKSRPAPPPLRPIIPKNVRPIILKNVEVLSPPGQNPEPPDLITIEHTPETLPQDSIGLVDEDDLIVIDSEPEDNEELDLTVDSGEGELNPETVNSVEDNIPTAEPVAKPPEDKELISRTSTDPPSRSGTKSMVQRYYRPTPEELKLEEQMVEMELFTCKVCGVDTETLYNLRAHLKSKHPSLQYQFCCDRKIKATAVEIYDHMRFHLDKDTFNCKECGNHFQNSTGLSQHVKQYHSGDSPKLVCEHCGKGFWKQTTYYNHVKTHGDKVTCTHCGNGKFLMGLSLVC